MSKQKSKGTSLETALVRYARRRTGDDGIHRVTLHGSADEGDVAGLRAHGYRGIAECKNYKGHPTKSQLMRWQSETEEERANADADFALLVVHKPGCNAADANAPTFGDNWCLMTVDSLVKVAHGTARFYDQRVFGAWVQMTIDQAFDLITSEL